LAAVQIAVCRGSADFKYWLKANAVAGLIASVALVAMICLSANSARPSGSVVTAGSGADLAAIACRRK
jgi:hypothetical protein